MTKVDIRPAVDVVDGRWMVTAGDTMTLQWELDLAQALGYEFEEIPSLTAHPFKFDGEHVVATEVVYEEGKPVVVFDKDGDPCVRTREVKHPLPDGWSAIADFTLTGPRTQYQLLSPFDRAGLQ